MANSFKHVLLALALLLLSGCCGLQNHDAPLVTQPMQFQLQQGSTTYFRVLVNGSTPEYSVYAQNVLGVSALLVVNPGNLPVALTEGQSKSVDVSGDGTPDIRLELINTTGDLAYIVIAPASGNATPTPAPSGTPGGSPTPAPSGTPGASPTPTPPGATPTPVPTPTPAANTEAQAISAANQTEEGVLMPRFDALYKKNPSCAQSEFITAFHNKKGRDPTPSEMLAYSGLKSYLPTSVSVVATKNGTTFTVVYTYAGSHPVDALKVMVVSGAVTTRQWLDGTTTAQNAEMLTKAEAIPGNCGLVITLNGWA